MSLSLFEKTQPLATRYFGNALRTRSLAHGYVFKGQCLDEMYNMALELAKILNCERPPEVDQACGECPNCHWIRDNSHPAVMTISRFTCQVDDKGNPLSEEELNKLSKAKNTKIKISTHQIGYLLHQFSRSSEHYRMAIFVDAEETPSSTPSGVVAPYEWRNIQGNEDKSFHIRPLERKLFNEESANRFLKTLEEPPPKTIFIFLAHSDADLLETIVSRCQVVPFIHTPKPEDNTLPETYRSFFSQIMDRFTHAPDFYTLVNTFNQVLVEGEGMSPTQALDAFQRYLRLELNQQGMTRERFHNYVDLQEKIELAKSMLASKTNEEQTLNHLFFQMSRMR